MSHEDATHGPAPLGAVEAAPLHAAVDALAAALHAYVGTAVGVRAEFGAAEADEDPRVLALEQTVGSLNAALFDALHGALGMHPDLTSSVWQGDGDDDVVDDEPVPGEAEPFYLGYVVVPAAADATMDGVLDVLDEAGERVTARLAEAGYDVVEWAASRGEAALFGDDDEDGEEEDR